MIYHSITVAVRVNLNVLISLKVPEKSKVERFEVTTTFFKCRNFSLIKMTNDLLSKYRGRGSTLMPGILRILLGPCETYFWVTSYISKLAH